MKVTLTDVSTSPKSPGKWCHLVEPSFALMAKDEKCVKELSSLVEFSSVVSLSTNNNII